MASMGSKEFILLLEGKLDEAKTKANINADLKKIEKEIDKLKLSFSTEEAEALLRHIDAMLAEIKSGKAVISVDASGAAKAESTVNGLTGAVGDLGEQADAAARKAGAAGEAAAGAAKVASAAVAEATKAMSSPAAIPAIDGSGAYAAAQGMSQYAAGVDEAAAAMHALLQGESAAVTTTRQFNENDAMTSFTLNVRHATGEVERLSYELDEASGLYRRIGSSASNVGAIAPATQVTATIARLNTQIQRNGRYTKEARAQVQAWVRELEIGDVPAGRLREINAQAKMLNAEMAGLGRSGNGFFSALKSKLGSLSSFFSATTVALSAVRALRSGISEVRELDTALVDLRKTAQMTSGELEGFYFEANETAKQMGVTTREIIEQAAAWSRLGYSTAEQATQMAKYSSMMKMISPGMTMDSATDGLVSVMKAFRIGTEDVSEVVDGIMSKINIIGNTRALNNSDIIDFLTKSSSAMAEANNSLEETIALGTAAVEITRDANSVGNAMKTISMRIRGYDEETEAFTGDVEVLSGKIADLTKTAEAPGGVSLFADEAKTEYKSTYQFLKDLSGIYSDLTDRQQAGLLEALAGKRQGQVIAAILNNFDAVEDSLKSMGNSAGNAEAEMAVVMDSVEYKANRLRETGVGIAQNLFDRDDMKFVLDVLNGIAKGLDAVTEKVGLLPSVGAALGGILSAKGMDALDFSDGKLALGSLFDTANREARKYASVIESFRGLDFSLFRDDAQGGIAWDRVARSIEGADEKAISYFRTLEDGAGGVRQASASVDGMAASLRGSGSAFSVAATGAKLLKSALNVGIFFLIGEALQFLIHAIGDFIHRDENAVKAMQSAQTQATEAQRTLRELSDTVGKNRDRFLELSEGVDECSNNVSLSKDEYAEYLSISQELAGVAPELVAGYDEQGNALLGIGHNAEETAEKLDALVEAQRKAASQELIGGMGDMAKGVAVEAKDARREIEGLHRQLDSLASLSGSLALDFSPMLDSGTLHLNGDVFSEGGNAERVKEALRGAGLGFEEISPNNIMLTALDASRYVDAEDAWAAAVAKAQELYDASIADLQEGIDEGNAKAVAGIEGEIQGQEAKLKASYAKMLPSLHAWMESDPAYEALEDESARALASALLPKIDWDKEAAGFKSDAEYQNYIQNNVISPLQAALEAEGADFGGLFSKLLAFEPGDLDVVPFADMIQEKLDELGIKISIEPIVADERATRNALRESISKIADFGGSEKGSGWLATLESYTADFTESQAQMWLEVTRGAKSAEEAVRRYEAALGEADDGALLSVSDTISQMGASVKPALDELGKAYQGIFTAEGFTLGETDILETCDAIKEKLDEIGGADPGMDRAFEDFARTLAKTGATSDEVQGAFDALATKITDVALSGAEDFETMRAALEDLGVTNSAIVAFDALAQNTEALAASGLDLANATDSEIEAFARERVGAEYAGEAILLLRMQKILCNESWYDSSADVASLFQLANAAGIASESLLTLNSLYARLNAAKASGSGEAPAIQGQISAWRDNLRDKIEADIDDFAPAEFSIPAKASGSGGAGKEAADEYVKAFEEELKKLQTLRDQGEIDESEYLDRLRELYTRYFADREEYIDEFKKYEHEYLDGMKSLYDDALSGISKLMGERAEASKAEGEAATAALEEECDARLAAIDAQKEQLQGQIDLIGEQIGAKEDAVEGIRDEIDAMEEANDERERQLDLQKAQYDLEQAKHQRDRLLYKGGQMVYDSDPEAEREAREAADEAQFAIDVAQKEREIGLIEDEIGLLEDSRDALQDQVDALEEQADAVEEYYSRMIESTEKYYQSVTDSLEEQKSRWEELADMEEVAGAYSAVEQVFGRLGYTVEDVLGGSGQAFEDFKSQYVSLLGELHSNESFGDGLAYAARTAQDGIVPLVGTVGEATAGLGDMAGEAARASDGVSGVSEGARGISTSIQGISSSLQSLPASDVADGWASAMDALAEAVRGVSEALGVGGEGTVGGLAGALAALSSASIGADGEGGLIAQFAALKAAVDEASAAVAGGVTTALGPTGSNGQREATQVATAGLAGAIGGLKGAADSALGGGEEGSGAIGLFGELKGAVDDVTASIGAGGEGQAEAGTGSEPLTGAVAMLGEATEAALAGGDSGAGAIGRFGELRDVIGEARDHVAGISEGLAGIDGQEVECTIRVNVETVGGVPAYAAGTALGGMRLGGAEYRYGGRRGLAHVSGTAAVRGDWGARQAGRSLVGELGQEIWIHSGSGRFETVGDRGAEFVNVRKGDVILNHLQTSELLRKGSIVGRGASYAGGTPSPAATDTLCEDIAKVSARVAALNGTLALMAGPVRAIGSGIESEARRLAAAAPGQRAAATMCQSVTVSCPNVTDRSGAEYIARALRNLGNRAMQEAMRG